MASEPRALDCAFLIDADGTRRSQRIEIAAGVIASVRSAEAAAGEEWLALPVLVNAHDHGRAIRTSSIGAAGKPLEAWLHYLALFPPADPYLSAAVSLSNSALGGAGAVMMHYTRAQGFTALPEEAAEVARAARDVGVRVGFAVSMKDRNPLVYGPADAVLAALPQDARAEIERRFLRTPLPPKEQVSLTDAVAEAAAGPDFNVQYGPNGVQWCSNALLEAVAEASARTGRRVHMHLLETRYQRAYLDREYGGEVVRFLDTIGLLSPRLTLAHCVWARRDELELLSERGVTIVTNSSSNLHLKSGIAPAGSMLACGCRVALGADGRALDDDDDMLREMRLTRLLHAGTGFASAASQMQMLRSAVSAGRLAVTNSPDGGLLAPGAPADLLLLDWRKLEDDRLRDDLDPLDLLFSRATSRHIGEVIVGGCTIVRAGEVLGIDYRGMRQELLRQMRSGMGAVQGLANALPLLDRAIAAHLEKDAPCL
jgi:cytosine/adenosine deaminase-related metal-dependent hydrolase